MQVVHFCYTFPKLAQMEVAYHTFHFFEVL